MRIVARIVLGIGAAAIVVVLASVGYLASVFGWPLPDCGPDSEAVARARSLTRPQLARLYAEMSSLVARDPSAHTIPADLWPPAVAGLHPRNVSADWAPRITLEGCFDEFVVLRFEGIPGELSPSDPKILVSWGGGSDYGGETVWQP